MPDIDKTRYRIWLAHKFVKGAKAYQTAANQKALLPYKKENVASFDNCASVIGKSDKEYRHSRSTKRLFFKLSSAQRNYKTNGRFIKNIESRC